MRKPTIEVNPDLRDRLKVQAVTEHTTIKKLVERVLKEYLSLRMTLFHGPKELEE